MPTFHLPRKWFRPKGDALTADVPNSIRAASLSGKLWRWPSLKTISAGSLNSIRATSARGKLCRCPSSKTPVTLRRALELELELDAEHCPSLAVVKTSASIAKRIGLTVLSMLPPRKHGTKEVKLLVAFHSDIRTGRPEGSISGWQTGAATRLRPAQLSRQYFPALHGNPVYPRKH